MKNLRKQTQALVAELRAESDDVKCRFLAMRLQRLIVRQRLCLEVKRIGVGNYTIEETA